MKIKITFLGTAGWLGLNNSETSCILIEEKKFNLILDLGTGVKNINNIKIKKKPTFIFLSHLHLDHIIGVHYLNFIRDFPNLKIFTHALHYDSFKKLFNSPYTLNFKKYKKKIEIYKFSKKLNIDLPFQYTFKKLIHPDNSYGFKFIIQNKKIVYCTDTRYCKNILKLSKKSDLLILECNQIKKKNNYHLSANEIKKNFNKFSSQKIVLTHYSPDEFKNYKERNIKLKKLKNLNINILKDLDVIFL